MPTSKRLTLVRTEDFSVDLEYNECYVVLHLPEVTRFTKGVYLEMLSLVEDIWLFTQTVAYEGLWLAVDPKDKVINKLASRLGFKLLGESDNLYVYQYEEKE